jgi:alpha-tubulin suppressor-like RCC1 family protein
MLHTLLTATKKNFPFGKAFTTDSVTSPATIGGASTQWKDIARGANHTVAIRADGTLWGWGKAVSGSLGNQTDNTIIAAATPVQIGSANTWEKVTSGTNFSLGLKKDGTVWGWGSNDYWQLGGPLYASSPYFASISTSDNSFQSIGLKTDGSIWVWGNNRYNPDGSQYSLGLANTSTSYFIEPQVLNVYKEDGTTLETFKYVYANSGTFYAITTEGRLYTWGYAGSGSYLANGTTPTLKDYAWPSPLKKVVRTNYDVLAITDDGKMYSWGSAYLQVMYNHYTVAGGTPTEINLTKSYTQFTQQYAYNLVSYSTQTTGPYLAFLRFATAAHRTAFLDAMTTYNPSGSNGPIYLDGYNENPDYESSRYTMLNVFNIAPNLYQYFDGSMTWYMVRYDFSTPQAISDFGVGANLTGSGTIRVGSTSQQITTTLEIADIAASGNTGYAVTSTGRLLAGSDSLSGMPYAHTSISNSYIYSRWTLSTGLYPTNTFTYYVNDQQSSIPNTQLADGNYYASSIEQYIDTSDNNLYYIASATINIFNNTVSSITINSQGGMGGRFPHAFATFAIPGTTTKVRVKLNWSVSQFGGVSGIPWINIDPSITYSSIDGSNTVSFGGGINGFAGLSVNGGIYTYDSSSTKMRLRNGTTSGTYNDSLDNSNFITSAAYKMSLAQSGGVLKWIKNSDKSYICDTNNISGTQYSIGDIEHISAGNTYSSSFYIASATSSVTTARNKLYAEGKNNYGVAGINIDDGTNTSTVRSLTVVGGIELALTKTPLKISTNLFKDIAAGEKHTLFIDDGSKLWGSGRNNQSQMAAGVTGSNFPLTQLGDITKNWKSVYAGGNTSAAIDSNDKAFTWGSVKTGAVGIDINYDGHPTYDTYFADMTELPYGSWSKLALYGDSATSVSRNLGLTTDGYIHTWGSETAPTVSTGAGLISSNIQFNGFTKLFSVRLVAYGIKSDGTLWAWGDNTYGQLGAGLSGLAYRYPIQVGTSTWTKVSTNGYTTVGIKSNGTLWVWGSGTVLGTQSVHNTPYQISTNVAWTDISVGGSNADDAFMLGLRGGSFIVRGTNTYGQLGLGHTDPVSTFTTNTIPGTTVTRIATGYKHSAILTASGTVRTAGANEVGQLGLDVSLSQVETYTTAVSSTTWGQTISSVFAGANSTSCIFNSTTKTLATAGDNSNYNLGRSARNTSKTFYTMVSGVGFTIATDGNGNLWGWGNNNNGQLSELIPSGYIEEPTQIGDKTWVVLSASGGMAAGVTSSGKLYVWGDTSAGNSGTGINSGIIPMTEIAAGTPAPTVGDPNPGPYLWKNVKLGNNHALGIKSHNGSSGTLWAWGVNTYGQLGLGNTTTQNTPTQVGTDTTWWDGNPSYPHADEEYRLSAGYWFSHAINRNGDLYGWGYNLQGQVGDSTTTHRNSPTYIRTNMRMVRSYPTQNKLGMSAGISYSDLYLYTWGSNIGLKLGHGQTGANNKTSPTKVGTLQWADVAVGQDVVVASRAGSLYTWGSQSKGELGNGYISSSVSVPTIIDADNTYGDVYAGYQVMYALSTGGFTKVWGDNSNFQLGLGRIVNTFTSDVVTTPFNMGYNIQLFDRKFEMTDWNGVLKVVHANKYTSILSSEETIGAYITVWGNNSATQTLTFTDHNPWRYEGITTLENTNGKYIGTVITDIAASADHVITCTGSFYDAPSGTWIHNQGGELGTIGLPSTSPLSPNLYYDGYYNFDLPMKLNFYRNAFVQNKYSQYPIKLEADLIYNSSSMLTDSNGAPFKDISTGKTSTASQSLAISKDNSLLVWLSLIHI